MVLYTLFYWHFPPWQAFAGLEKNFAAINLTSHESHEAARKANLPKETITYKIFILCVKLQRHAIIHFWKDLK